MKRPWSSTKRQHDSEPKVSPPFQSTPADSRSWFGGSNAAQATHEISDLGYRFRQAWTRDGSAAIPELLPVRLTRACVEVLPVAGAGLSLLNDDFRVPLGASGPAADAAERLQFTQGEGPCLDAARSGRIVIAQADQIRQRWPAFGEQLQAQTPFLVTMSVPLPLSPDLRGALDLYFADTDAIATVSVAAITIVSDQIVQALQVAQAITGAVDPRSGETGPAWLHGPSAENRTKVWVAMGMLMTKLHLPAADALARLRAYAYANNMDLDQLATDLTEGTLDLDRIDA